MRSENHNGFKISPNYRAKQWQALKLDPTKPEDVDWTTAIAILKDRIDGRFLEPAGKLIEHDAPKDEGTFGFAILALDFLVIETLQGFREGRVSHRRRSTELSTRFLTAWAEFQACVPNQEERQAKAENLYSQGRCALHHRGSTDKIVVRRGKQFPMLQFDPDGQIEINRTKFHQSLTDAFDRYLTELKQPEAVELRRKFKKKMDAICADTNQSG